MQENKNNKVAIVIVIVLVLLSLCCCCLIAGVYLELETHFLSDALGSLPVLSRVA